MRFLPVSLESFNRGQQRAVQNMDAQQAFSVSLADEQEDKHKYTYFMSGCGQAGFAICGDYLAFLWKHPMAHGEVIPAVLETIEQTYGEGVASYLHLDCFEWLAPVYERHGFRLVQAYDWNDDLAPKDWPKSMLGTPSYCSMFRYTKADTIAA